MTNTVDTRSLIRICHIADIHWRGLSRHDEYKHIFEKLFIELKRVEPDVIYVGGDVFHTKTQNISPEIIELLSWWFRSLADIAHVVVTLGNHDGNLMNRHRQDAITPIITLLADDRITLLKRSGTYPSHITGVNWCVFSCFDEHGWSTVKPVDGDINIAFFHGAVKGSTTDQGHELRGEVAVEFFDPFDFALLGDIHKTQFLAHRTCIDGEVRPWVGYCGSTIQQNYGEALDHGFLVWDINSRDDFEVKFVGIDNPHRFVTLEWHDDLPTMLEEATRQPPGTRFRIKSASTINQGAWRQFAQILRRDYAAKEVTARVDRNVGGDMVASREFVSRITRGFSDPETVARLIRDHITSTSSTSTEDLVVVEEMVTRYVRQVKAADELARNVVWSIDRIEFSNTFAYGENNVIDFSALSGITGIFAGNAMGKSSVIGTLMYTLFNATDRGPMKNLHVINTRHDSCETRARLTINGDVHEITRATKKVTSAKGDVSAITNLQFTHMGSGELLNGEQRTSTEQRIRQTIGTAEDFMLTSLAAQDGLKAFIKEGASVRKAILTRFLDLQIFELVHERAKLDSASIKARMRDFPERDWASMFSKIEHALKTTADELDALDDELRDKRAAIADLHGQLAGSQPVSPAEVDRQRRIVEQTASNIDRTLKLIASLQIRRDVIEHGLELIDRVHRGCDITSLRACDIAASQVEQTIEMLRKQYDVDVKRLTVQRRSAEKLALVPCGDAFPSCMYIKDSHHDAHEIPKLEQIITNLEADIERASNELAGVSIDVVRKKLERYQRIVSKADSLRRSHDTVNASIDASNVTLEADRLRFDEMKASVEQLELQSDDAVTINQRRIRAELNALEIQVSAIDSRKMQLAGDRGRFNAALERLQIEQSDYETMSRQWRAYELIIAATSKRGVPSQVLRHLIPTINDEIARILHGIVKFTVAFDLPEDSNAMEVYIDYGDDRRLIELASGMEKMVASIAIRVALINISKQPKTDMLIIDEGFSDLDETNIEACGALLRGLTQWFRSIIIITHIDSLKDVVDNVIDIGREGHDAVVSYT